MITPNEMSEWIKETWERCQAEAWAKDRVAGQVPALDNKSSTCYNAIFSKRNGDHQMEFLKRAESYAAERGDDLHFKEYYTTLRATMSVEDSAWGALRYLYDGYVADCLQNGLLP